MDNSSDIEFEIITSKRSYKPGQRSIEKIIEYAVEDRLSSEKTAKTLEYGHGPPSEHYHQDLWVNRFNAFRITTLRQSLETPFTGDDLIRFLDSHINKLEQMKDKPAPNINTFVAAVKVLLPYRTFTYPASSGYKFHSQDGARLRTWMDDAVRSGHLIKGNWQKQVWLSFVTVQRMAKA